MFEFFTFRNENEVLSVTIQMLLLLAGFVVILGIVYVLLLILMIVIHHIAFDKDPAVVPDYIKRTYRFSSDEEETEDPGSTSEEEYHDGKPTARHTLAGATELEPQAARMSKGPTAQQKAQIMDKFILDLDQTRNKLQKEQKS